MDLLILLVERRGELVTHEEIIERLWGKDVFVEVDTGIHTAIRKIRRGLADGSNGSQLIEAVPGKGYRFCRAVHGRSRRSHEYDGLAPDPAHPDAMELYSFANARRRQLTSLPFPVTGRGYQPPRVLAASRDGRWVIVSHMDYWERDIVVADNYR